MKDNSTNEVAVLDEPAAAKYIGISVFTLRRKRRDGTGPKIVQLSARRIGYRRATLDAWLAGAGGGVMTSNITVAIKQQVPSIPKAVAMLEAMQVELTTAKTYEQIRRVIREATALKVLLGEVDIVKATAEDTILTALWYIGEELKKVPKANKHQFPLEGKLSGKEATGVKHTARSRYGKLASVPMSKVKETSAALRKQGKDATVKAVVTELTYGDKKRRRAERVEKMVSKALPKALYNIFVIDVPWRTETWSTRAWTAQPTITTRP